MEPIHNRGYQEYARMAGTKKPVNDEKFTMDAAVAGQEYENAKKEGVVYEPTEQKKPSEAADAGSSAGGQRGSYTQTTVQGSRAGSVAPRSGSQTSQLGDVVAKIREVLGRVFASIKATFSKIWNSEDASKTAAGSDVETIDLPGEEDTVADGVQAETKAQEAGTLSETIEGNKESASVEQIRANRRAEILAKRQQAAQAQTTEEIPRLARNTSLLTQYNARGQIVVPDASDQQRILHGDRGLRKQ